MTYDEISSLSVGFVVRKYHISAVDWHYKPINQGIRALSSRNRIENHHRANFSHLYFKHEKD